MRSSHALSTASNHPLRQRMLDVIRRELGLADHVDIAVSFLRFSGLGLILDDLIRFRTRGGRLRLLTSTYLGVTQPDALRVLASLLEPCELKLYDGSSSGFHVKLFAFRRGTLSSCWVGSSNLTKGGLASNLELNVCQQDPTAVAAIHEELELLWHDPLSRWPSPSVIDAYAARLDVRAPTPPPHPQPSEAWVLADSQATWLGHPTDDARAPVTPNEAQREAMERLRELRQGGERRAVIIAAPGIGKTYLAAFDAAQAGAGTVLFVSHRLEHLRQAQRTFARVFPGRRSAILDGGAAYTASVDFVFASIQSLSRSRALKARRWNYIVIDEFHHAHAPSYRALIEGATSDFILGLTATPERQDGHDVLRLCDYNVAWEVRLHEAIRRRWLIPFHYFGVADATVEYSSIPWRNGRFDPTAVENALAVDERVDLAIHHAIEKGFDGPRRATVGFCAGRRHALFMTERFNARGLRAEAVTGDIPITRREEIYRDFVDPTHPLEWLFVADVLNEGVDLPAINSLLFLRPTDSATIFIQQLGRGLRLHPGCEVLTVVDLVGHHRRAWLPLTSLADPQTLAGPSSVQGLQTPITPPPGCEVILDDQTRSILGKIDRFVGSKRARCTDAWQRIREELGATPYPVDFIGRDDEVLPEDFRAAFGDWITVRTEMGDAEPWELALAHDNPLRRLLARCESNWQAQRVYPYALLWGAVANPADPAEGFRGFFDRFRRWRVEQGDLARASGATTLAKKLGDIWQSDHLDPRVFSDLSSDRLLLEVERRIQYHLEKDFRARHGGILRTPQELRLWNRYRRPEIINHFGRQFDPARHNAGIILFRDAPFRDDIVIITKLDTAGAQAQFHYTNAFEDAQTFRWQSQNKNTPESEPGRRLVTPGLANIHLFVQEKSHHAAVYCGLAHPIRHEGSSPIDVWFRLSVPVPEDALEVMMTIRPRDEEPADAL